MPGQGAFKFSNRGANFRNISEFREAYEYREACEYEIGDRVRWIQKKDAPPLATVVALSGERSRVRIRFDNRQREFDSIEVWIDRQGIEPEEA